MKRWVILILVVLIAATALYFRKPRSKASAIAEQLTLEEQAWQRHAAAAPGPAASAALSQYLRHQKELVRLGHYVRREFDVPVDPKSPEYKELVSGLMSRTNNRPTVGWTPQQGRTRVSVVTTPDKMPEWEKWLSRFDLQPAYR